jgi:hypothetical protein
MLKYKTILVFWFYCIVLYNLPQGPLVAFMHSKTLWHLLHKPIDALDLAIFHRNSMPRRQYLLTKKTPDFKSLVNRATVITIMKISIGKLIWRPSC